MLSIYKKYFAELLATHILLSVEKILAMIEIPPENISGDFAFPCFKLSKLLKQSPQTLAEALVKKLTSDHFSSFEHFTWYVNAHINKTNFVVDMFSQPTPLQKNIDEKIMIEYMNANPNKPLHIGQARNVCIGDSMRRIYEDLWYKVHAFNYGDDSGVNVWYNIVWHLFYGYDVDTEKKYDHYCGKIYEEMRKKEEDPKFKTLLSTTLRNIETWSDDKLSQLHYTYTRKCVINQIRTCWRMNSFFDAIAWETNVLHLNFFSDALTLLKEKWFVKFIETWDAKDCRVLDLSSLPEYSKEEKQYQILVKSDGVATYIAKDIAFALWKLGYISKNFGYAIFDQDPRWCTVYTTTSHIDPQENHYNFGNYDTAITVIDNRQIPAQTIVKSTFTLLKYTTTHKHYRPLGYGVVYLTPQTLIKLWYVLSPEELAEKRLPFSSRKWRTVTIDEMLDMLHTKAYTETKSRNPEKNNERLTTVAECLAVSALRFFLIRGDVARDIIFDLDEVLDMQGETGAYILYTWARIQSIIDSAGDISWEHIEYTLLQEEIEFALIKKISSYEDIIMKAKDDLAPHYIAKYCFDLAQLVNSYYAHTKILWDNYSLKCTRIYLLKQVRETLKKSMNLIGMKFLERM